MVSEFCFFKKMQKKKENHVYLYFVQRAIFLAWSEFFFMFSILEDTLKVKNEIS